MKKIFDSLGASIHKYAKWWIGAIVIITIFLTFGLPKIQMKMGNDVFVSPNRPIYKNSRIYQKHFGGDSLYLLLNGSQKHIISHPTMKNIAKFNHKATNVKNITSTTNVVNLVNDELKDKNPQQVQSKVGNVNQAKLKKDLIASIPSNKKAKIQKAIQASLLPTQKLQIQQYTKSLITPAQKKAFASKQQATTAKTMAQATGNPQAMQRANQKLAQQKALQQNPQLAVQKLLTSSQRAQVQAYTMTILNPQQKQVLMQTVSKNIPKVQNMSTGLLRDVFLTNNGKVQKPLKMLFPKNGHHALVILNTTDKSADMTTDVQLSKDTKKAIKNTHFNHNVTVKLAGQPHILGQVNSAVLKNMGIMLIFAVILMIIILASIFPVRRRLLPLLFVLVCLDWTFGIMGWVNLPLTLATMATLPIIIGLGTDFGVQFLNRYEEEFKKHHNSSQSTKIAIENMGPAVGTALIVMALSFMTMFLSKAPLMQKFGLTLAIGVICSYFVEMILIFATLSLSDAHLTAKKMPKTRKQTKLSKLLTRYAGFVMRHAWVVLILGIILGGIGFATQSHIGVDTQLTHMIPQNMTSLKNTKYLERKIGSTTFITYLVKGNHLTNAKDLKEINQLGQKVTNKHKNVYSTTSIATTYHKIGSFNKPQAQINTSINKLPSSITRTLISKHHKYATLQFKINHNLNQSQQLKLMNSITHQIGGQHGNLTVKTAGTQNMMLQGIKNMTANRNLIMIIGLLIIFLVLFLVYRNWRLAIFPVIPIMIVLGLSPLTLFILHTSYNPLTVALSSLVLGIGIEFTILIMSRYREEINKGSSTKKAITDAIRSVGQAITASGLTVIGGFVAIMFASFPVLRSFGMITVLDTAYSLISALTILPAFIFILRKRKHNKN